MRTLRIYSQLSYISYINVSCGYHVVYITSLVLTYLITRSLYLLTTFLQFLLPLHLASGNHKSDLFFCELVVLFFLFVFYIIQYLFFSDLFHLA